MRDLSGKKALITGASSGIGAAIAVTLAAQGVDCALTGRAPDRLEAVAARVRDAGGKASTFPADLLVAEQLTRLQENVGAVDILVHSAGIATKGTVAEASVASLRHHLELNTVAPYTLTQAFLPALRERRGDIVFINSRAGLTAFAGLGQYCASKFALKALADSLRLEVAADGLRVVSVYPGKVATPMQEKLQQAVGRAYVPEHFPAPEEVAEVVLAALQVASDAVMSDVVIAPQQDPLTKQS